MRPPRALDLRGESGITLVETVTSMMVFSVVMTFTFVGITSAWRSQLGVERRQENLTEARTIMDNLTKDIRTATRLTADTSPFTIGEDTRVQFYANLNVTTGPKRVTLYVDGSNRLVQETVNPAGTAPNYTYNGTPTTRVLGSYVVNPPSTPIFVYYDSLGVALTTPLSAADLLNVDAVGVTLSIRRSTNLSVKATTLIDRVRLPNVDYNPLTEG